jgi:hypothetical protein
MPFTLAHPAAVLPLRRWPRLDFTALVIGSMTPDFGYYLLQPGLRLETHSLAGSLETCLPIGLLLTLLFGLMKEPLCRALPQPHRGALLPLATRRPAWTPAALLGTALAVLLGIWTHLLSDAFTHRTYWGPQHIDCLRWKVFSAASKNFLVSDCLQWLSSLRAYGAWLKRQPVATVASARGERRRWLWLLGLAAAATLASLPFAATTTDGIAGYEGWRAWAFQAWVHAAVFFCLLLAAYAPLCSNDGADRITR